MKKTAEEWTVYVEERLAQWADWYSRGNLFGLGYPSISMEYRLMREGTVVRTSGKHQSLPSNEAAEEIESLVKEMSEQNVRMALVLRCHYFNHGSLRIKAKKLDISYTHYRHYVELAKQWLLGRLTIPRDKLTAV